MKLGKSKKQNKIGQANFSNKITHRNLCFATTKDGQYTFACGFEDNSFVVWDIDKSKLHQGVNKHNDIVSCLALDEDVEKQKAILVTGSYDKSVMVWRVNINHKQRNASSKQRKMKSHSRKNSTSSKMAYTELIDPNPTHILENQLAAVMCVDVSIKSGIIVCCSLDGIVNVYNASTGEHYHMLQPYIDKAMRLEKQKSLREAKRRRSSAIANDNDNNNNQEDKPETKEEDDISPSPRAKGDNENEQNQQIDKKNSDSHLGSIPSGELTICRVSSVFGHVLCYSKQTKDIFLYSSAGELESYANSRDDIYYDIQFSKTGNHLICGGTEKIIRIKELPSFKTRKKFEDPKKEIRSIYLDKDETYILVGDKSGNVLVYSLPQKAFVKSRVHTLTELGF